MKKALATLLFQISQTNAWQLPFGQDLLKELKELGFESHNISHYGCYCRFSATKYAPEGEAQDEYDKACFNYSQCVKCLDLDQCKIQYPRIPFRIGNEFCSAGETGCENNLCKCQKRLVQEIMDLSWSQVYMRSYLSRDFNHEEECLHSSNLQRLHQDELECCGEYPDRFIYTSENGARKCCGQRTYNSQYQKCCADKTVKLHGECS